MLWAQTLAQGEGPAAGSEWRCCSTKHHPHKAIKKARWKIPCPTSNRDGEPKWSPLVTRGWVRHKISNQKSPYWKGCKDLKAGQSESPYSSSLCPNIRQTAGKKNSEHHKKQNGGLSWTVLLYSLSSTKYNCKYYCLILEHNSVDKALNQVYGLISYLFYCLATQRLQIIFFSASLLHLLNLAILEYSDKRNFLSGKNSCEFLQCLV